MGDIMSNIHTTRDVLTHHNIAPVGCSDESLTDYARDHGVLTVCLGCATVTVAPAGYSTEDYHAANPWAREVLDSGAWDCCPDANTITY
jgi:hypothetical protein